MPCEEEWIDEIPWTPVSTGVTILYETLKVKEMDAMRITEA